MRLKVIFTLLMVFAAGTAASGQTKVKATQHCGKAEKEYRIDVGDRPGHVFAISQLPCTWENLKMAGVGISGERSTCFAEVGAEGVRYQCFSAFSAANGDTIFGRWEGTFKPGRGTDAQQSSLRIVQGPGKLEGLKSKWSCRTTYAADGTSDSECEGEYELPE